MAFILFSNRQYDNKKDGATKMSTANIELGRYETKPSKRNSLLRTR